MNTDEYSDIELLEYEYIVDIIFYIQHMIQTVRKTLSLTHDNKTRQQLEDYINIIFSWLKPLNELYKQAKSMFNDKLFKSSLPSADNLKVFNDESDKVKNKMLSGIEELKTYTNIVSSEDINALERILLTYNNAIESFIKEITKPI